MALTQNDNLFQFSQEVEWQEAGPGIQRQVFGYNKDLMLVKVKFEKGAVGAMHQHPHTQASYVESGSFELIIGDEKRILHKGDGYFVPPDLIHGCTCLEAGMLIDVFNPLREDFIN